MADSAGVFHAIGVFPSVYARIPPEAYFVEHEPSFRDDQDRSKEEFELANLRKRFGKHVMKMREERGWTQEDLAAASGVSARSISSIENGVYSITLDTAYKLSRGLELPLPRIFDF